MPSVEWNIRAHEEYPWPQDGNEWSQPWGTPERQWEGTILPRISPLLGGDILEIAPGHGRWTAFLLRHGKTYVGIDVTPSCVRFCQRRFPKQRFILNDGYTLPLEPSSIDFAFSQDSLVHAEEDVMESYVAELARVLRPSGAAYLHHSNLGEVGEVPPGSDGGRGKVSAGKIREFARRSGMSCIRQEIVPAIGQEVKRIDCLSIFVNSPGREEEIIENPQYIKVLSSS